MDRLVLHKLSLVNFKNYAQTEVVFADRFNCIIGNNGEGKTNLLDAIHYLSFTKSCFNPVDSQNIMHQAPMFVIQGEFARNGVPEEVFCAQKRGERKLIKWNKKEVARFADHIGRFPAVLASPSDSELIQGGSEARRKFADSIISQYDREYLEDTIRYAKALAQRNALLKQFGRERFDAEELNAWNARLVEPGNRIVRARKEFSAAFEPLFRKYYDLISGGKEQVEMIYQSQLLDGDFEALLNEALEKDRAMEFSTVGTHKDDWEFRMGGYPAKKFSSQGQQKSYLLAVRLAQFEFIREHRQVVPILMLDDLYDKLDETRVRRLIDVVAGPAGFGQVFITDTGGERIQKLFKGLGAEVKLFTVKRGSVSA